MSRTTSPRLTLAVAGTATAAALLLGLTAPAATAAPAAATPAADPAATVSAPSATDLTAAFLSFDQLPDVGLAWTSQTVPPPSFPDELAFAYAATDKGADGIAFGAESRVQRHHSAAAAQHFADSSDRLTEQQQNPSNELYPESFTRIGTVDGVDVYRVSYGTWGYHLNDVLEFAVADRQFSYVFQLILPAADTPAPDLARTVAAIRANLARLS